MRYSQRLFSLRTYALAFAVVLSPAFFQTATTCARGDTYLLKLEFEVGGENELVGFNPNNRSYNLATAGSTAIVRTQSRDPASTVTYQWIVGGTSIEAAMIGVGGGDVTLTVPDGQSTLRVSVRAPENARGFYTIDVDHLPAFPCTEQGILDAIDAGGGPHYFACGGPTTVTTTSTILFDNGGNVILDGEGNLTVDANGGHGVNGVIYVSPADTVELRGMTVTGGATPGASGAGIRNNGTLTLTRCIVTGNTAESAGGLYNTGDLTLDSTVVSGNTATNSGGGGGGVFQSYGTLSIFDSTISNNIAANAAGILVAGGEASIVSSTISGNTATTGRGGGVDISGAVVTIVNSTISGNTAFLRGDGIHNASSSNPTSLLLISTTVTGNAGSGTGEALFNNGTLATFAFLYSVIDGSCLNLGDPPLAQYTIESPGDTCGLPAGSTNLVNVSAAELTLGPLQDNGGPTLTHAPLEGSVAIDFIPEASCLIPAGGPLTVDQRGIERPENAFCDVGAVEGYCADCSNTNDCDVGACDPVTRACSHVPVADGTLCGAGQGACVAGVCEGFACTEQGIRDAIAVGGGPIAFDCTGPTTVTTTAEIIIDNDVILDGEGLLTVDGNDDHRVFSVASGLTVELSGFTVSGGSAYSGGGIFNEGTLTIANSTVTLNGAGEGAGIYNAIGGDLEVTDTTVTENTASYAGGGIYIAYYPGAPYFIVIDSVVSRNSASWGGGIWSSGEGRVINSVVSDNTADGGGGGGIQHFGGGDLRLSNTVVSGNLVTANNIALTGGGGIENRGTLTIRSGSVVTDNTATGQGGGIYNFGPGSWTLVDESTVSNNTATGDGGGIHNDGGRVDLEWSTMGPGNQASRGGGINNATDSGYTRLFASTVTGNIATVSGGGVRVGCAPGVSCEAGTTGELWTLETTISGNAAPVAPGIMNLGKTTLILTTVVEGWRGIYGRDWSLHLMQSLLKTDCVGTASTYGYNIESPGTTCGLTKTTDQSGVTAEALNLGPLQDNGGPTLTHAPVVPSVAIDQIPAPDCADVEDQRGHFRPGGGSCDIGAVEF